MLFEIPTALTMTTAHFWVVTQCSLVHLPHTPHTPFLISHNTEIFSCKSCLFSGTLWTCWSRESPEVFSDWSWYWSYSSTWWSSERNSHRIRGTQMSFIY